MIRILLPAGMVLLLVGCAQATARQSPSVLPTLKETYANTFVLGTAVNEEIVAGTDAAAQEVVIRQFNTITAENVMITELDVDVLALTREGRIIGTGMTHPQFQLEEFREYLDPYAGGLPEAVQRQLAERYAELFRIFHRKRDRIHRVTLWGVHDGMSWKNDYPIPDRTSYPLLFGRDLQPKPAFHAVLGVPGETR